MGTRSFVGTVNADGEFMGRYVHWDGYPTCKGPQLTSLLARFDGGLEQLLGVLTIDNYGWSHISLTEDDGPLDATYSDGRFRKVPGFGVAYTTEQGQSSEDEWVTGTLGVYGSGDLWGTEWGYLFTSTDSATADLIVVEVRWNGKEDAAVPVAKIPVRQLHQLSPGAWELIERQNDEPLAELEV